MGKLVLFSFFLSATLLLLVGVPFSCVFVHPIPTLCGCWFQIPKCRAATHLLFLHPEVGVAVGVAPVEPGEVGVTPVDVAVAKLTPYLMQMVMATSLSRGIAAWSRGDAARSAGAGVKIVSGLHWTTHHAAAYGQHTIKNKSGKINEKVNEKLNF